MGDYLKVSFPKPSTISNVAFLVNLHPKMKSIFSSIWPKQLVNTHGKKIMANSIHQCAIMRAWTMTYWNHLINWSQKSIIMIQCSILMFRLDGQMLTLRYFYTFIRTLVFPFYPSKIFSNFISVSTFVYYKSKKKRSGDEFTVNVKIADPWRHTPLLFGLFESARCPGPCPGHNARRVTSTLGWSPIKWIFQYEISKKWHHARVSVICRSYDWKVERKRLYVTGVA